MPRKGIYLFMWSYQDSYRIHIQILVRRVLAILGAPEDAEVFIVGARSPDNNNHNPVCIEPEDGIWVSTSPYLKQSRLEFSSCFR